MSGDKMNKLNQFPAIDARGLRKVFRTSRKATPKAALDGIDITVARGERVAIVGLNGSGKSTLIRVLATLTTPDAGTVSVFGLDVVRDAHDVRRHINRVSVEASFFKEMSPWENLAYATHLYGLRGPDVRARALAALQRLGLPAAVFDKPMKHLSRGQQQKVAIARSLLSTPALLLMDEPTTGLDPRSKREVQSFVSNIHEETGATVLICTHDLAEAEALCDRIVFMDRGRILVDAQPHTIRAAHGDISLEDVFLRLTGKSFDDDTEDEETETHIETVGVTT
jgi:ABC-2 type transport system ATP-binding protein